MKIILSHCFICVFSSLFGQIAPHNQWFGFGYGYAALGDGVSGSQYFVEGRIYPKNITFLSVTSRLSATILEKKKDYGSGFFSNERSNGINIESEISYHLPFWKVNLSPSIGPSLRFVDEKILTMESFAINSSNQVIDYENRYDNYRGIKAGFTAGLNLDFSLSQNLILGARMAGYVFHDGTALRTLSLFFRKRYPVFHQLY